MCCNSPGRFACLSGFCWNPLCYCKSSPLWETIAWWNPIWAHIGRLQESRTWRYHWAFYPSLLTLYPIRQRHHELQVLEWRKCNFCLWGLSWTSKIFSYKNPTECCTFVDWGSSRRPYFREEHDSSTCLWFSFLTPCKSAYTCQEMGNRFFSCRLMDIVGPLFWLCWSSSCYLKFRRKSLARLFLTRFQGGYLFPQCKQVWAVYSFKCDMLLLLGTSPPTHKEVVSVLQKKNFAFYFYGKTYLLKKILWVSRWYSLGAGTGVL